MIKKTRIWISLLLLLGVIFILSSSCQKDKDQKSEPKCHLINIKNAGDTIIESYTYDKENRITKIQYFIDATADHYAIYNYTANAYTYKYFNNDGSLERSYENPLPFNSHGLTDFAYHISYGPSSTRYDSIFYEYNADNYKTKETRWLKIVSIATGEITLGKDVLTYTYLNNNCTTIEEIFDTDNSHLTNTYEYEYYLDKPNKSYNITPWLGKLNANYRKKMTYTSFDRTTNTTIKIQITDIIIELDSEGRIAKYTDITPPFLNLVFKYTYECM
jgi:hypothetical protein